MPDLQDAAPRNLALTMADFLERRGYDPSTRTYVQDEAPDYSGMFKHSITKNRKGSR